MQRINYSLPDEIARAAEDLADLKTAQQMTADSWILYYYSGTYTAPASGYGFIIFTCDNPDMLAVVRMSQEQYTFELLPTGIYSQNGIYFFATSPLLGSTDVSYVITSTQPGTVTTSSSPPF